MASIAPSSSCIYKTVTLAVGETFTLPPGAEIVASTGGLESFTSTCPKPTELVPFVRYCFRIVIQNDRGRTEPFQYNAVGSEGIFIGEQYYPFASGDGAVQDYYTIQGGLQTWLTRIPGLIGVFRNTCVNTYSSGRYGDGCMTCFDVPEDIAKILSLDYGTQDFTGTNTYIHTRIEAQPAGTWPDGC